MDLIIDANIFIAALISPRGHTADLFFLDALRLYAPEFLLEEIDEHEEEIVLKTGLSEVKFHQAVTFLRTQIRFVPVIEFLSFLPRAKEISPDVDDVAYFALALKQRCSLLSNNKLLK